MYRAFTLLESLFVLLIISLLLVSAIPLWNTNTDQQILTQESQKIYAFIRKMQARAENSSEIWYLVANQNLAKQEWCLTAQIKSDQICDCFRPKDCPNQVLAHFYEPAFPHKTMLISKKYYPLDSARLNGMRSTTQGNCFAIQVGKLRATLGFQNSGNLTLSMQNSDSACREQEEQE